MSKYIDAGKLIAEIEQQIKNFSIMHNTAASKEDYESMNRVDCVIARLRSVLAFVNSLQQEQPIEGKQVIIITETDCDANIHWYCRSLDDVMALLTSAKSFIADKQIEELRGKGSGPDYNTVEGRFRNAHKFHQEQQEVQNGKFVFPKYLYARTKDNKTIDMSYAPQDMTAVEYVRNDFVEHEQPEVDLDADMEINLWNEVENFCLEYDARKDTWYNMTPHDQKLLSNPTWLNFATNIARHFYELGKNARKE